MFRSEANHLYFVSKTDDIFPVSAALHNLIHKQGYQDIILDFSQSTFLDPKFMVPLVTTARSYRGDNLKSAPTRRLLPDGPGPATTRQGWRVMAETIIVELQ
jgi:hypothetical protein